MSDKKEEEEGDCLIQKSNDDQEQTNVQEEMRQDIENQEEGVEHLEVEKQRHHLLQRHTLKGEEISGVSLFFTTVANFIFCSIFAYPFQILYSSFGMIYLALNPNKSDFINVLIVFIFSTSTVYMLIMTIVYYGSQSIQRFWFYDSIGFYLSTMLVISYIKSVHDNKDISRISYYFYYIKSRGFELLNTLFIMEREQRFYSFDCRDFGRDYQQLFKNYMIQNGIQPISQRYSKFQIEYSDFKIKNNISEWFEESMQQPLQTSNVQIAILLIIVLIKSILSIFYLLYHKLEFNLQVTSSVIATTLFYIYFSIVLLRVLGSYDLKRKTSMMNILNERIDYREQCKADKLDESNLVDITCSTSIESWDNARTYVTQSFNDKLSYLELAYLGLFFYYLFVATLMISAYGEFYWVFDQNSVYLEPLMVIQYSIDFIFLNAILFIRIWEGQSFNDTFSEIEDNLDYLIDVADDLMQMYDYYFIPKQQALYYEAALDDEDEEKNMIQNSLYALIVKHIENKCHKFIQKGASYQGEIYQEQNQNKLQQTILKNMKQSLKKVKRQLNLDAKSNSYRFLGMFELQFSESFFTMLFALFSFLPNIIPQVISMFKEKQS